MDFVSVTEAAGILGVHRETVRNYLKKGWFPNATVLPSGTVRIPLSDVEAIRKPYVPESQK